MKMNMKHMLSFLVITTSVVISLPNSVKADEKRYPGSMCHVWSGRAYLNFSSLVAYDLPLKAEPDQISCPPPQAGGCPPCKDVPACRNNPKYIAQIDCPIPKSFPDSGTDNVTVDVIDRHDFLDVECYLTSAKWDPMANKFNQKSTKLKSWGKSNAIQPLVFAPQSSVGSASHWYIACSLPPNSVLVSYYVKEK